MPTVEKTTGGSVYLRSLDRSLTVGDRVEVGEEHAAYLCEERGDFGRVNQGEEPDDESDAAGEGDLEDVEAEDFEGTVDTVRDAVLFDPAEHTIEEIEELVDDVEKPAELNAVREIEESEKDRSGALDVINDRRDELEGA